MSCVVCDDRIRALQAQNQRLKDQIEALSDAMGANLVLPLEWRLTPKETGIFGFLMTRELATKQAIMSALYGLGADEEPDMKIVDVFVCKLRRKIRPFGLMIETVWGQGYALTAETKRQVDVQIAQSGVGRVVA